MNRIEQIFSIFSVPDKLAILLGNATSWALAFLSSSDAAHWGAALASAATALYMIVKTVIAFKNNSDN